MQLEMSASTHNERHRDNKLLLSKMKPYTHTEAPNALIPIPAVDFSLITLSRAFYITFKSIILRQDGVGVYVSITSETLFFSEQLGV